MSTIAENVIALTNQRLADQQKVEDAKAAIRLKGVIVPVGDKLGDLDDKISLIDEWVAPSDWIQLETPNDNEILLLASDMNPHYAVKVEVVGGYYVDWGDGTVDECASGAIASHSYTEGDGQACSRGYTTFKIRIYAQVATNNITLYQTSVSPASFSGVSNGLLWAKFGTRYIEFHSLFGNHVSPMTKTLFIESVEFPEDMKSTTASFTDSFRDCFSLENVKIPKTVEAATSTFDQSFLNTKIRKIDLSCFPKSSYMYMSFSNCPFLGDLILPQSFSSGMYHATPFVGIPCKELVVPHIIDTLDGRLLFQFFKGKKIVFNETHENKIVNLSDMFNGCNLLSELKFVNSVNLTDGNIGGLLYANSLQRSFRFPDNTGVPITNINNIFGLCGNLGTVTNFPALNSVTNLTRAFYMCASLKNIDNLDQLGDETTGMDLVQTYTGCYSLNPPGGLRVRNKITGRFVLTGVNTSSKAALQSLLFTNQAAVSTWGGTSPQIDVSNCSMDATALDDLFESIIATSVDFGTKTIRITGNPGAATCDTSIITDAGGTVNLLT